MNAAELHFRFHDLRHTYATWAVMNDVPLYDVKELLRHADIETMEIYAKLNLAKLRDSVKRISPPRLDVA